VRRTSHQDELIAEDAETAETQRQQRQSDGIERKAAAAAASFFYCFLEKKEGLCVD